MHRLRLLLCAVALGAVAIPQAQADPVAAIERHAARLAGTRMGRKDVVVARGRHLEVTLRPDHKVIVVSGEGRFFQRFGARGFFLGPDGRLTGYDRKALEELVRAHAPGTTDASVEHLVREESEAFAKREQALRRQDPLIHALLGRASAAGRAEVVLWQGRRGAELRYRPDARVLVGSAGAQHGFSVEAAPEGLRVAPAALDDLRGFLHDHQRP